MPNSDPIASLVPDLINRLAASVRPVRRRNSDRDLAALALLGAVQFALVLGVGLARPDMHAAMAMASFWWKLASLGPIAVIGAVTAILSLHPATSPRSGMRWIGAVLAACVLAGGLIDASGQGITARATDLATRLDWHGGIQCVAKMVVLSLPALIVLGALMRRGAATRPGATALAVGLASSAWGAFVFAFACPHDDPLYIAVWYALGCGIVVATARLLLPRLTRW